MDRRQHSLALMLYAYLGAIAAGINFYWSVDDTPLAAAMYDHSALVTSWNPGQSRFPSGPCRRRD
jgi:hypothetical protein